MADSSCHNEEVAPVALGLKRKACEARESAKVFIDGFKLRAGTVPWRCIGSRGEEVVQLMLIESINTPGQWSFPAGSLDSGEEVSICAARETQEECGANGVLGCFLGSFDNPG